MLSKHGLSRGVVPACVNFQPASAKHVFSNSSLSVNYTLLAECGRGALTMAKAQCAWDLPSACLTWQAIRCVCSLLQICFQIDFLELTEACASALTNCPNHVSFFPCHFQPLIMAEILPRVTCKCSVGNLIL